MTRFTLGRHGLVLALGAAPLGVACEEKKPSSQAPLPDANAGTDKYATADPKLAKVLQGATAAAAASDKGPPPGGIFAAGVADQRHPKGSPTHVELVAEGSEPRVSLLPAAEASPDSARTSSYGPALLELAMQMGPRVAMPTIDFGFALGPAKKDDGGAEWLVADVKKAVPSRQQLGQLPPGMDKDVSSLTGTSVRIKITPDGCESDMQMQLSKAAHTELDRVAMGAAEALVLATVPLPAKPVGVGAQWIAETRMALSGIDVIAYRAYRVKALEGDRLRLALDVKAYAASKEAPLQGVPKGATLEEFETESGGEIDLVRGETLARKSEMKERVIMVFQAPGASPSAAGQPPGGMMTAQLQTQATLVRGEDMRVTAKQP
ncbi:MAG TPA: hypothetical protein VN894_10505 [Polyangiaceae bacterium]|nr:hypothetical protein [Polyangiaceae bacterium]